MWIEMFRDCRNEIPWKFKQIQIVKKQKKDLIEIHLKSGEQGIMFYTIIQKLFE